MLSITEMMTELSQRKGSDLYISVGSEPIIKVNGDMVKLCNEKIIPAHALAITKELVGLEETQEFMHTKSLNFAHSISQVGRFRVNGFFQRNEISFVIRVINFNIPTLETLGLPDILRTIALEKRGLILFVGATGSGKSTSLASLIQYRNSMVANHILTIEDPIEYLHKNNKSLVNQREVGIDAVSYEDALQNALREAPDAILMGEVRSRETMNYAIEFAETGHLCLSTLHANSSNQAVDRIINFFPSDRHKQLFMDLSLNLRAIVSQRLLPNKEGNGRVAAIEILINTPTIASLILKGEVDTIKGYMENGAEYGMQTFDQALSSLFMAGKISLTTALSNADSDNNLRLSIQRECLLRDIPDPTAAVSTGGSSAWTIKD
jgi:twitching motility protein PilU